MKWSAPPRAASACVDGSHGTDPRQQAILSAGSSTRFALELQPWAGAEGRNQEEISRGRVMRPAAVTQSTLVEEVP